MTLQGMDDYLSDEEFEDYESDDLFDDDEDGDHDYVSQMWGAYAFRGDPDGRSRSYDLLVAHGMVESFINAFARDGRYVAVFDEKTQAAATDLKTRRVVITPAPVYDPKLTAQEAGRILTALAVHEISHARYGKQTHNAVNKAFPKSSTAFKIGNLLDDVRIERRFVADYPGYAGIFRPVFDYIAPDKIEPTGSLNIGICALRYDAQSVWNEGNEGERRWWKAWAARWAKEDAPRRHVQAVREALEHIVAVSLPVAPPVVEDSKSGPLPSASQDAESASAATDGEPDDAQDTGSQAEPEAASGGAEPDPEKAHDKELGEDADTLTASSTASRPACPSPEAVDEASGMQQSQIDYARAIADEAVRQARDIEDGVHVLRKVGRRSSEKVAGIRPSPTATRYITEEIMRSRSGHTSLSRYQKRGSLDERGLHRVATSDFRLFSKKSAPSPGKFLIWVLVDCSSSMSGSIGEAASVAMSIAAATRHVPSIRAAVWGWSHPFARARADAGAALVWRTGQATAEVAKLAALPMGGTPDTVVLNWAHKAIRREARNGETPVIIFCSDGDGYGGMNEVVNEARESGVLVYSVAIGHAIREQSQIVRYGKDNYVTWRGSITATAKPLAQLIARMVRGERHEP